MSHQLTTDPNADTTPLDWSIWPTSPTTHYTKIDEGMQFKSNSDYVQSLVETNIDEYGFPSDAPSALQVVTEIWVDLYMQGLYFSGEPGIRIRLYAGAVLKSTTTWAANTSGAWQVRRHKITGLSLTKTEYNSLDVRIEHVDGSGGGNPIIIT